MKIIRLLIITLSLAILSGPRLKGKVVNPVTGQDSSSDIMLLPVDTAVKNLDEVSGKQLSYFMEITESIDILNQIDWFKPYNRKLKEKISRLLKGAAAIEPDQCHKKYLNALSKWVLEDTFHSLDPEWFDLEENKIEIIFAGAENHIQQELLLKLFFPIDWETFNFENADPQERLASLSASGTVSNKIFDTFIYTNDFEETRVVEQYIKLFNKMLDNLPPYTAPKVPYTQKAPPIKIARLVYSSLPQGFSLVYPDPQVFYRSGRFKIVIFKNIIESYVQCILKPIAGKIFSDNRQMHVDTESYLSNLVMHKISHHIGPVFALRAKSYKVNTAKKEKELKFISEILGYLSIVIEELKARVIGLHNTSVLIEEGLIPREKENDIYAAYLVSLVDRLRKKPRSQAENVQFNYLLKKGGIVYNINTGKLSIQPGNFVNVVKELTEKVLKNYTSPYSFINRYKEPGPELQAILDNLEEIPVKTDFQFDEKTGIPSEG